MDIKVMTYNINGGKNIAHLARLIAEVNPHVCGIQEATKGLHYDYQFPDTAHFLESELNSVHGLGYTSTYYFPAYRAEKERYPDQREIGNAIITRLPIKNVQSHSLSTLEMYRERDVQTVPRDAEPRIAIEGTIYVDQKPLRIIVTHTGVSRDLNGTKYSELQLRNLLGLIGDSPTRTIVMGDLNIKPSHLFIEHLNKSVQNARHVTDFYQAR